MNLSAGTGYSQVAVYTCNPGYRVAGDGKRQCQSTGSWSGTMPICRLYGEFFDMSRIMRKPDFCICENKDADQLRSN